MTSRIVQPFFFSAERQQEVPNRINQGHPFVVAFPICPIVPTSVSSKIGRGDHALLLHVHWCVQVHCLAYGEPYSTEIAALGTVLATPIGMASPTGGGPVTGSGTIV